MGIKTKHVPRNIKIDDHVNLFHYLRSRKRDAINAGKYCLSKVQSQYKFNVRLYYIILLHKFPSTKCLKLLLKLATLDTICRRVHF